MRVWLFNSECGHSFPKMAGPSENCRKVGPKIRLIAQWDWAHLTVSLAFTRQLVQKMQDWRINCSENITNSGSRNLCLISIKKSRIHFAKWSNVMFGLTIIAQISYIVLIAPLNDFKIVFDFHKLNSRSLDCLFCLFRISSIFLFEVHSVP